MQKAINTTRFSGVTGIVSVDDVGSRVGNIGLLQYKYDKKKRRYVCIYQSMYVVG